MNGKTAALKIHSRKSWWKHVLFGKLFREHHDRVVSVTLSKDVNALGRLIVLLSEQDALVRGLNTAYVLGSTVVMVTLRFRHEEHCEQVLASLETDGFPYQLHLTRDDFPAGVGR